MAFARRVLRTERSLILGILVVVALWVALPGDSSRLSASGSGNVSFSVSGLKATVLTNLSSPQVSLVIIPPEFEGKFGTDLYAAVQAGNPLSNDSNPIVRIHSNGSTEVFRHIGSWGRPSAIELPAPGSAYVYAGNPLFFLSLTNPGGDTAILDIDQWQLGNTQVATGEAGGLAFADLDATRSILFTAVPGVAISYFDTAVFPYAGWFRYDGGNWIDLEYDAANLLGSNNGGSLYAAADSKVWKFARSANASADATQMFSATQPVEYAIVPGGNGLRALKFSHGGIFGNYLYAGSDDGGIHRISPDPDGDGDVEAFASMPKGVAVDGIDFSYDGKEMYVATTDGAVYRISKVNSAPSVTLDGPFDLFESAAGVTVHATATDPDNDSLAYSWSIVPAPGSSAGAFGSPTNGSTVTYLNDGPSNVTVHVQVNDGHGGTASAQTTIELSNVKPTVSITGGILVGAGTSFLACVGFSDPAGTADAPYTVAVNYGDATGNYSPTALLVVPPSGPCATATGYTGVAELNHVYDHAGSFSVGATVADKDGGLGANGLQVTVTKAASNTSLASSGSPSLEGNPVTFTATVGGASGVVAPTGTVTLLVDGANPTTSPLGAGGTVAFTVSALTVGPHSITATYNGDVNYTPSSASLSQSVTAKTPVMLTQSLSAGIQSSTIPDSQKNSLMAKLSAALASIQAGQSKTAANQLGAFLNELNAQAGKKIPVALANDWAAQVQTILSRL